MRVSRDRFSQLKCNFPAMAQFLLLIISFVVCAFLAFRVRGPDLHIEPSILAPVDKSKRVLVLALALLVQVAFYIYLLFAPLSLGGGKANSSPILFRALVLASAASVVGAAFALARKPSIEICKDT
jgi:hypothetical protein